MTFLARALVILAIAVPWLGFAPWDSRIVAILTASLTLTAAFHGAGRVIARLARRPVDSALAIQWGIAALIAIDGLAILFHFATARGHALLLTICLGAHGLFLANGWHARADRLVVTLRGWRSWIAPVLGLAAIAVLYIFGSAGDLGARPFDDDGNYIAQVKRLLDTGTLGDSVGFVRASQLGGQVALGGFGALTGDLALTRWLDNGLLLVLALALAVMRIGARDATATLWTVLVLVGVTAFAFAPQDPSACWSAIGLLLALYTTLDDHRETESALPIAVLAGALATLRSELVPIAIVGMIGALVIGRRPWPGETRRIALVVGVVAGIVLPYLLTRWLAWSATPDSVHVFDRSSGSLIVQLAVFGAITAVVAPIVVVVTDRIALWPAIATVAGIAGILSQLTGTRPYATRFLWPIVLAFAIVVVVELARKSQLRILGLVVALVGCFLIVEGRDSASRVRWSRRMSNLAYNLDYLGDPAPLGAGYGDLLAKVPRGATVAVWVGRPELLDYAAFDFVDLRTPRGARLRTHRWTPHASPIATVLAESDADYLLIESDHVQIRRQQRDPHTRFWCATHQPECDDDLESVANRFPTVAQRDTARLVVLRTRPE